jgi:membrane-associated phospholipid phosphatase
MKITSQFLSWLFIPLITPVLGVVLVMFLPSYQDVLNEDCLYTMGIEQKWKLLYYYFFFCMLVPGLALLYLKGIGVVSTIEIDDRRERALPILIMFCSCLGLYLLHIMMIPKDYAISKYVFSYPLAGVIGTAAFFFQTIWKKVSLHAGGMGILSGFLIAYAVEMQEFQMWIILVAIVTSGMVMSARIYLGKHTLLEVAVGWFTGTFVTFVVNYYY